LYSGNALIKLTS